MASETPSEVKALTEEEIKQLPEWFAVALAARCAFRVAPVLGRGGNFAFWGISAISAKPPCMAVEAASLIAALKSIGRANEFGDLASPAAIASAAAADAAAYVADAAAYAAAAATDADLAAAAASTAAKAIRETDRIFFHTSVRQDYEWLTSFAKEPSKAIRVATPTAFFERPLWERLPEGWEVLLAQWQKALIGIGLEEIYRRHERMLKGGGLDWDEAEQWVRGWFASQERNIASENETTSPGEAVVSESPKRATPKSAPRSESPSRPEESAPTKEQKTPETKGESPDTAPGKKTTPPEPPPAPKFFNDGFTPSALGDQPSKHDHLGREKLARVLASMFASKAQGTPFTVAILGEWGSGKSTLMELIKQELEQPGRKGKFDIAEFNAWEYEHTDNIRAGLAQEVVNGLTTSLKGRHRWKFIWEYAQVEHRSDLKRMLAGLIVVILVTSVSGGLAYWWLKNPYVQALMGTGVAVGVVTFLVTAWKNLRTIIDHPLSTELTTYLKLPSYGEHLGQVPVIKRQLKSLCQLRLLPSADGTFDQRRLIVFVDDLDRCSPKCITETLDAIRLVMNIPSVIVVIMIDHRIAMKAVAEQYASLADQKHDKYAIARDFLGKIIQVPITLMPAAAERMNEFIAKALFPSAKSKYRLDEILKDAGTKPVQPPPNAPGVPGSAPLPADQATPVAPINPPPPGTSAPPNAPAPSIRTPAQVDKEQARMEEEMQDTVDDREFFQRLVKAFGCNNPRQLLRMRNSFRVLKGIERGSSDQPVTAEKGQQMMLALFWLELLNDQTASGRASLQSAVLDGTTEISGANLADETRKFRELFFEVFGQDIFGGRRAELQGFLSFVGRFVLPYHEGIELPANKGGRAEAVKEPPHQAPAGPAQAGARH